MELLLLLAPNWSVVAASRAAPLHTNVAEARLEERNNTITHGSFFARLAEQRHLAPAEPPPLSLTCCGGLGGPPPADLQQSLLSLDLLLVLDQSW